MSSKKSKSQSTYIHKSSGPLGVKNEHGDLLAADDKYVELKEETLRWIFSILGALIIYWVVAAFIQSVYHPDLKVLIDLANKYGFSGDARPEPVESLLFRSGVIIISLSIIFFYFLLSKMKLVKNAAEKHFFYCFSIAIVALVIPLIYADFAAQNPFGPGSGEQPQNSRDIAAATNFDFFFNGIFLGDNLLLYTFVALPLIACIFYFSIIKFNWENNRLYNKTISIIGYVVAGAIIIAIVGMNSFAFPYTFENKFDFNAVYYSMTQVYAGVPMMVDGFSNTYGLYPHFLNPFFHVIGLSVLNFSCVMACLAAAAFLFNFLALKSLLQNKIILILGFCTVVFFSYLDFKLLTGFDSIFSFFPVRYIVPSTLLFLSVLYLKKGSQLIYWLVFVLMGLFILWNPEIGIVSYVSWIVFNIYNDFFTEQGKVNIKKILFHLLAGIFTIIAVLLIFSAGWYIVYGSSPNFGLLFGFIAVFGKLGFGLLPMRMIHPWNMEAIILILGFTYCIVKWYKKERSAKVSVIFLVSVIALGFMAYFQGRSHNWPFTSSSGFCLILVTILGDELWLKIKTNRFLPLHLLFVIFLFTISFSFFEILFDAPKIMHLVYPEDDKEKQLPEQEQVNSNTDYILKNSKENEKIFLFTARQYEGLYFDGYKRKSAFNPGYQDMVLNTDITKMAKRITDSSFNIFIEPTYCNYPFLVRPLAAVAASYEVSDTNKTMALLKKRKTKTLLKTFFDNRDTVIHRKYGDDTDRINSRINDALGVGKPDLHNEFSVEILFYANEQIYPYASLIGNMNDSSGFMIAKILHTQNYFFGINGKGVSLPMPQNQWVYCAMNVYLDHFEVFENGNLSGSFPLASPLRTSPENLSIGNMGYLHYYIGSISEVAIHNSVLYINRIHATWEEINKL